MEKYVFQTAEKSDYDRILKFLAEYFYHEEPSVRATKASIDEWLPIFGEMVESSLRMPLSIIVTTEESDTVVAVLLNSVWEREKDEQRTGADHEVDGFSDTMQRFLTVLQKCHNEFWSLAPSDIKTVIYREISSVGKPWQRQGIASEMLVRNHQTARSLGIDGIVSATSSFANQTLLAKNGFECLKEFPYSSIVSDDGQKLVEPDDGSVGMRINFKRL
ncbi:hypothetical protein CAEBREN_28046 [Caenorhabditis brenneri]|uniref:aralkylamine N-acetyltransferase n=1 Tax=Caenorhabditis brenneri TaxID=135651 RepID=G0N726_CAEBE|nr:hypothetical protein CAEBREN_28046 [Caenorhabditis brenneri]